MCISRTCGKPTESFHLSSEASSYITIQSVFMQGPMLIHFRKSRIRIRDTFTQVPYGPWKSASSLLSQLLNCQHQNKRKWRWAYPKNFPLKAFEPFKTSFAMTFPGWSGLSNLPSLCKVWNFATSVSCIVSKCFSRTSLCISVSTTPGRTEMLVTSGSSTDKVRARWFSAAFDAP